MSADQTDGERESQLSAMFDGELPAGECELVARRLAKDENLRRSWDNYSLIGAVMRSEPLARRHLAPQVAAVVQAERSAATSERPDESVVAAGQPLGRRSSVLRWAGGFGVAAAVGAVAIFIGGQPRNETIVAKTPAKTIDPAAEAVEEVVIPAMSTASADDEIVLAMKPTEPESYVTPPIREGAVSTVTAPVQLANFVAAHSAVAAPMLRHSTLSTLITSAPIVDEPPMEPRVEPAAVTDDASVRGEIL
jgi:negative regulator of sigma E activity